MQCKCGCGEETKDGLEYTWGHKTRTVRPAEKRNACACGCGELVRGVWAKGHCNRRPPKERVLCGCGCGELASIGSGYITGHNSRTDAHRQMKREMFNKLWKESPEKFADRDVWNTGLTKETDERLKLMGRHVAETYTPEKREYYKQLGREATKFLKHPSGSDAHNWQGGITAFRKMGKGTSGRSGQTLYTSWKRPLLQAANNRCTFCDIGWGELHDDDKKAELHVHHNSETMSSILRKFTEGIADVNALSWDERIDVWQNIVDYHIDEPVSGQVLCDKCHMRAHRKHQDID